jgi:glyoxylase I family protein
MLLGFEHVGVAVSDMDRSLAFYCDLLGLKLILRKTTPGNAAELAFVDAGGGQLELVASGQKLDAAADLPPTQAGVRHITFAVDDINAVFERLMIAGVVPVEKARDAHNKEVIARTAFVRDPDGLMVEIAQH